MSGKNEFTGSGLQVESEQLLMPELSRLGEASKGEEVAEGPLLVRGVTQRSGSVLVFLFDGIVNEFLDRVAREGVSSLVIHLSLGRRPRRGGVCRLKRREGVSYGEIERSTKN